MGVEYKEMYIWDIKIEDRVRRRTDNVESLAESIKALGMIHAPAVTADGRLIAGERRIAAARLLGYNKIDVRVLTYENAADLIRAEMEENTERENFTAGEAQLAAERWAVALAEEAARRRAHGQTAPGRRKTDRADESANASAKLAEASRSEREARTQAAKATGYGAETLRKVKAIRDVAEGKRAAPRNAKVAAQEAIAELDTNPKAKVEPHLQKVEKLLPKSKTLTRKHRDHVSQGKRKAKPAPRDFEAEQERIREEQAKARLKSRQMNVLVAIRYLSSAQDLEELAKSFDRVDAQEITRLLPVAVETLEEFNKYWRNHG
jgi:ParB-like chromosome segregation protein Spo0J